MRAKHPGARAEHEPTVELEPGCMHPRCFRDGTHPVLPTVTQGRGERLLGVMLVGNAILRFGEGREKAQICQVRSCMLHQPHYWRNLAEWQHCSLAGDMRLN